MERIGRCISGVVAALALGVLTACSSGVVTASEARVPATAATPAETADSTPPPTPAPATAVPAPTDEPSPTPTVRPEPPTTQQRADWALAVAGYTPFNFDGQDGVSPALFGADTSSQEAGYACYQNQLAELIDIPSLLERFEAKSGWIELLPVESVGARKAVANCMTADLFRSRWIEAKVFGWNEYGRASTDPKFEATDPCFAPVFDSPEAFVVEVVSGGSFPNQQAGVFGPFDCRASVGLPVVANPSPTPLAHPWHPCEVADFALEAAYRVTNIPADDPDGGLVTHVAPGVDADAFKVLPDGTDQLQVSSCQQNLSTGSVWWLVTDAGWVNARYLESYVPSGPEGWQPGLSNRLDPTEFASVVGLEAPDLDTLAVNIGDVLIGHESPMVELIDFIGIDAQGGRAVYDVLGLRDDSVAGYRIEIVVNFIKDDTADEIIGLRIGRADGRAICSRGVSNDGRCV